jgi:hypothetical protein
MTTQEIQAIVERYFGPVTSAGRMQSFAEHYFEAAGVSVYVEPPQDHAGYYVVRVWHGYTTKDHDAALVKSHDLDSALCEARQRYAEHLAYFVRLSTLLPKATGR